jgi:hypothetical protein
LSASAAAAEGDNAQDYTRSGRRSRRGRAWGGATTAAPGPPRPWRAARRPFAVSRIWEGLLQPQQPSPSAPSARTASAVSTRSSRRVGFTRTSAANPSPPVRNRVLRSCQAGPDRPGLVAVRVRRVPRRPRPTARVSRSMRSAPVCDRNAAVANQRVPERLVGSGPLCTRHVVGVRHRSRPLPSLWAQPKTRLRRRLLSGESRDQAGT